MMDNNDDLTVAARVKGWEIFSPDWDYLLQRTSLPLVSLCALSVGLHPAFADPSWVFNIAMPHFNGTDSDECCPLEDAEENAKRAALLHDFIQRVNIANDELAPRGGLTPIEGNGALAVLRIADFTAWATGKRWRNLPDELTAAAVAYAVAPEGLQDGCAKWPWGNHETELLRKMAAAANKFWKLYDPSDATTACKNEVVIAWLKEQGVSKRTAEVMATILRSDTLPLGPRASE